MSSAFSSPKPKICLAWTETLKACKLFRCYLLLECCSMWKLKKWGGNPCQPPWRTKNPPRTSGFAVLLLPFHTPSNQPSSTSQISAQKRNQAARNKWSKGVSLGSHMLELKQRWCQTHTKNLKCMYVLTKYKYKHCAIPTKNKKCNPTYPIAIQPNWTA